MKGLTIIHINLVSFSLYSLIYTLLIWFFYLTEEEVVSRSLSQKGVNLPEVVLDEKVEKILVDNQEKCKPFL